MPAFVPASAVCRQQSTVPHRGHLEWFPINQPQLATLLHCLPFLSSRLPVDIWLSFRIARFFPEKLGLHAASVLHIVRFVPWHFRFSAVLLLGELAIVPSFFPDGHLHFLVAIATISQIVPLPAANVLPLSSESRSLTTILHFFPGQRDGTLLAVPVLKAWHLLHNNVLFLVLQIAGQPSNLHLLKWGSPVAGYIAGNMFSFRCPAGIPCHIGRAAAASTIHFLRDRGAAGVQFVRLQQKTHRFVAEHRFVHIVFAVLGCGKVEVSVVFHRNGKLRYRRFRKPPWFCRSICILAAWSNPSFCEIAQIIKVSFFYYTTFF